MIFPGHGRVWSPLRAVAAVAFAGVTTSCSAYAEPGLEVTIAERQLHAPSAPNANLAAASRAVDPSQHPLAVPATSVVPAIAAGLQHSIMLNNDGAIWARGSNGQGEFANDSTANSFIPVQVVRPAKRPAWWRSRSGGRHLMMALQYIVRELPTGSMLLPTGKRRNEVPPCCPS